MRPQTDEGLWVGWVDGLPEVELPPRGRVVVVAAHPDDETLGVGGTMQRLAAGGWQLHLVLATDGEAAYGGDDLGPTRLAELDAALGRLGLGDVGRTLLHLPDRAVAQHEDALAAALPPADLVIAPYRQDGHRDHDACGRAAARHGATLLEYPIWAWHWTAPDALPRDRAARLPLSDAEWERKQHALAAYASQDGILPEPVLAHFRRRDEVLLA